MRPELSIILQSTPKMFVFFQNQLSRRWVVLLGIFTHLLLQAEPARPLVGAIRWDAQVGDRFSYGVEENAFLGPAIHHDRIPFYGQIRDDGSVFMDGTDPSVMAQEIEYARQAGLDYWAFLTYDDRPDHWGYWLGKQLDNYLHSPNRAAVRFAVILASHEQIGDDPGEWPRWIDR